MSHHALRTHLHLHLIIQSVASLFFDIQDYAVLLEEIWQILQFCLALGSNTTGCKLWKLLSSGLCNQALLAQLLCIKLQASTDGMRCISSVSCLQHELHPKRKLPATSIMCAPALINTIWTRHHSLNEVSACGGLAGWGPCKGDLPSSEED